MGRMRFEQAVKILELAGITPEMIRKHDILKVVAVSHMMGGNSIAESVRKLSNRKVELTAGPSTLSLALRIGGYDDKAAKGS